MWGYQQGGYAQGGYPQGGYPQGGYQQMPQGMQYQGPQRAPQQGRPMQQQQQQQHQGQMNLAQARVPGRPSSGQTVIRQNTAPNSAAPSPSRAMPSPARQQAPPQSPGMKAQSMPSAANMLSPQRMQAQGTAQANAARQHLAPASGAAQQPMHQHHQPHGGTTIQRPINKSNQGADHASQQRLSPAIPLYNQQQHQQQQQQQQHQQQQQRQLQQLQQQQQNHHAPAPTLAPAPVQAQAQSLPAVPHKTPPPQFHSTSIPPKTPPPQVDSRSAVTPPPQILSGGSRPPMSNSAAPLGGSRPPQTPTSGSYAPCIPLNSADVAGHCEIWIVRHGQTEENLNRTIAGHNSNGLTALGRQQADMTAERLQGMRFDSVYISDLVRTKQTADPILRKLPKGTKCFTDKRLREKGAGNYMGYKLGYTEHMAQLHGQHFRTFRPPGLGGESWDDVARRGKAWLAEVVERFCGPLRLVEQFPMSRAPSDASAVSKPTVAPAAAPPPAAGGAGPRVSGWNPAHPMSIEARQRWEAQAKGEAVPSTAASASHVTEKMMADGAAPVIGGAPAVEVEGTEEEEDDVVAPVQEWESNRILVVTHGGFIGEMLMSVGIPVQKPARNCSIHVVGVTKWKGRPHSEFRLMVEQDISHLAPLAAAAGMQKMLNVPTTESPMVPTKHITSNVVARPESEVASDVQAQKQRVMEYAELYM